MPIMLCVYSRHINACGTKSPQGRHLMMQNTSYVRFHARLTFQRSKRSHPFTTHMTQYDYDA